MLNKQIIDGAKTALLGKTISSNSIYRPQFISNNFKDGRKVLSTIEYELSACEEFIISVAFITMSGLTPLLQTLKELEASGKKGRILNRVRRIPSRLLSTCL